ncbi:uncharacterized protein V6R79_023265 [Siganus canaliculatus]
MEREERLERVSPRSSATRESKRDNKQSLIVCRYAGAEKWAAASAVIPPSAVMSQRFSSWLLFRWPRSVT